MEGALTRGQATALAVVQSMIANGAPHALLFVGPPSVGKTTLALDLAAGLLCVAADRGSRPCRACRGCRLLGSGNHPDLHWLRPGGPGNQIKIQSTQADPRPGVRELIEELSLLPMEGGVRVAIVEAAHRMNDDAQNALLKLLEEPPAGVHFVLCADDEDRLLPTIQSRCARIRLGTVATRDIEAWLSERGVADPPVAARLSRLAEGRPGRALAYALAPEAVAVRAELDRALLDLLTANTAPRLVASKRLLTRAGMLDAALAAAVGLPPASPEPGPRLKRSRRLVAGALAASPAMMQAASPPISAPAAAAPAEDGADLEDPYSGASATGAAKKSSASERRRAALMLVDVWRHLATDLMRAGLGDVGRLHDPGLLEEITADSGRLPRGSMAGFLARLDRVARAIDANASPELALDVLAICWPRLAVAA